MMVGIFEEGVCVYVAIKQSEAEVIFKKNVLRNSNCLFVIPTKEVQDELLQIVLNSFQFHLEQPPKADHPCTEEL